MHNRHPPLTTTTTGHDGSVRLELDKQGVGRRMREGIDDKAFPEQGAKVSIHSDGSFEGLGCVLANTNLNVLTVFYWFTLKRDEPKPAILRAKVPCYFFICERFWGNA